MRAVLLILLLINCYGKAAFCQSVKLDWAKQVNGSSYDICQAITLDEESNIYATGYFSSIVDFDPGPNTYSLSSADAEDIFISKSDAAGNLIWAKSIGGFRYQAGYAITLDAAKNIYITGIFFGTVDFNPGPDTAKLISAGNEDIFICKFDNDGNFKWAKKIGGSANDYCNAILVDSWGNIYLNGYFNGTSDFEPGNDTFNLTAFGQSDIFICKLNITGNLIWAKQVGGNLSESAYSIALDAENNVYSTGFFLGTADFDPGPATTILQSAGFGDGFILKLNTNGDYIKAGKMGSTEKVRCNSIKFDKSGYLYIAGYFDGDADFNPGPGVTTLSTIAGDEDIFIAKYNLSLNLEWVKQIVGPSFQKAFTIDVDQLGNIYTSGHFNGSADFDPGPANFTLTSYGDPNIFVSKLTSQGAFVWAAQSAGVFFSSAYSLKTDLSNNIYLAGTFDGTTDFDPGPEQFNLTSAGQSEIFIQKLRQCANTPIANNLRINSCTSYFLNNIRYDTTGTYTQTVLNSIGCDSIIIVLDLTIKRIQNNISVAVCSGQTWYAGGKLQRNQGVYYDTLKTMSGCDSVVITNLAVNPSPLPNLGINRNICEGVTNVLNPGSFKTYLWQDFSTQPTFATNIPGTYKVTVTNQYNCTATASVTLKSIVPLPNNFLPADKNLCTGNIFKISVPGYKNYLWSTGVLTQDITIKKAGIYYLSVTSLDNCVGTDTIIVKEINCIPTGIPNAFTPNNDGINDHFRPIINLEIKEYQLRIYNRLGQLIFETKNSDKGWDGTFKNQPQATGAYVYKINFKNIDGKFFTHSGNIILIR